MAGVQFRQRPHCVQKGGFGVHPTPYSKCSGDFFLLRVMRQGRETDNSHLSNTEVKKAGVMPPSPIHLYSTATTFNFLLLYFLQKKLSLKPLSVCINDIPVTGRGGP
jgi:hypothetical protein